MVLNKKQKILLISFSIIVLITIGLLYWHYSPKIIKSEISEQPKQPTETDFSIFQDPRFKELKNLGQELDLGPIGRENPFTPLHQ